MTAAWKAVDVHSLDAQYFFLEEANEDMQIYSGVVYYNAFKMDVKLAFVIFFENG